MSTLLIILVVIASPFCFDFVKNRMNKNIKKENFLNLDSALMQRSLNNVFEVSKLYSAILKAPSVRYEMKTPPTSEDLYSQIKWDCDSLLEFVSSVDDVLCQGLDLHYVRVYDKKYLDRLQAYAALRGFEWTFVPSGDKGFWEISTFRTDLEKMI